MTAATKRTSAVVVVNPDGSGFVHVIRDHQTIHLHTWQPEASGKSIDKPGGKTDA